MYPVPGRCVAIQVQYVYRVFNTRTPPKLVSIPKLVLLCCCVVMFHRDTDLQFAGSREANLLDGCREALAAADEKAFATAVAEFDSLTRLDTWKTNMLLRVKRRLQARSAGQEAGDNSEDELL